MADFPTDPQERAAERRRIRMEVLTEAEGRALQRGRSLKCRGETLLGTAQHAGDTDGCRNSGATCICDCHDPAAGLDVPGNGRLGCG